MSLLSDIRARLKGFTQSIQDNGLMSAFFQFIRPGQVIMINDNPDAYIKEGYYKNPNLATVVDLIAVNAASIKIKLVEIDNATGEEEDIDKHEILDILDQPNESIAGDAFFEALIRFQKLTGNSYIYSPRPDSGNNMGRIPQDENGNYQMHYIPSQIVEIISGGPFAPVAAYKLQGTYGMRLDKFDVLHIKRPSVSADPSDQLYGESPIKSIRSTLAISNMANAAQFSSFKNGGVNGIVTFKGAAGTPEAAEKLKADFKAEGEGATKIGKVIATSADVDYLNMGRSNVELGVLDSETASLRKIASHFQVDPGLVGDPAGSTFSNRKDARKAAYTDAYIPALEAELQGLNKWLCPWYASEGKTLELRPDISSIPEMQPDQVELWTWLNMSGGNIVIIDKEELDESVFLEEPNGVYTLHCRSDKFNEKKYGATHEYNVTFYETGKIEISG